MISKNRREEKTIWLIFIASFIIRITKYVGMAPEDAFVYTRVANEISEGILKSAHWVYSLRHLVTVPTGIFYTLFGVNDYSTMMWPLLCYAIEFLLVMKICRKLFPDIITHG